MERATRAEHLQWCKDRAIAYLPDAATAYTSFMSDMGKHPETADHPALSLGLQLLLIGAVDRRFIEGFN